VDARDAKDMLVMGVLRDKLDANRLNFD